MPDHLGDDMRKTKTDDKEEPEKEIKGNCYCPDTRWVCKTFLNELISYSTQLLITTSFHVSALDDADIALLKTYVSCIKLIF